MIEDVERCHVGREGVPRQHPLVEKPVEQILGCRIAAWPFVSFFWRYFKRRLLASIRDG